MTDVLLGFVRQYCLGFLNQSSWWNQLRVRARPILRSFENQVVERGRTPSLPFLKGDQGGEKLPAPFLATPRPRGPGARRWGGVAGIVVWPCIAVV